MECSPAAESMQTVRSSDLSERIKAPVSFFLAQALRAFAPRAAIDDNCRVRSKPGGLCYLRFSLRIDVRHVQFERQTGIAVQRIASRAEFVLRAKVVELDVAFRPLTTLIVWSERLNCLFVVES